MRTGAAGARWSTAVVLLAAALAAVLAVLVVPAPLRTPASGSGDAALVDDLRRTLPPTGHHAVAAAVVDATSTRTAALGPVDPDTPVRIESVTKVLTGMLLADAVERGEVQPGTTVGEVFGRDGFADPTVPEITLAELATHTSGLGARLPVSPWRELLPTVFGGPLVLPGTPVDAARETSGLGSRGRFDYSNLGAALLGQALAVRAGTDLPELARQRLLEPLGMTRTSLGGPPDGAAGGRDLLGRPVADPVAPGWEGAGFAGYSSVTDLARLLDAVSRGEAPGQRAVEPVTAEMGLGWVQGELGGRAVVLHGGGSAGASSFVAVEPGGRGVVVVADGSAPVGPSAARLLGAEPLPEEPAAAADPLLGAPLGAVAALLVVAAVVALCRGRTLLGAGTAVLTALAGLLLGWNLLPPGVGWQVLWGLLCAVTGGALARTALDRRRLVALPRTRPSRIGLGLVLLLTLALVVLGTSGSW